MRRKLDFRAAPPPRRSFARQNANRARCRTDTAAKFAHNDCMETRKTSRIVFVERLRSSVLITFEDGRCALYSAALLYAAMGEAREIFETDQEDDEAASPDTD